MMNVKLSLIVLSMVVLAGCSTSKPPSSPIPTTTPVADPLESPVTEKEVVLETPVEDSAVTSPLTIEGLAPGTWFFEGQIIGQIISQSGQVLATVPLMAEGEWMTEQHVRFNGEAKFTAPAGDTTIKLVIKNDNPSGLPENEKSKTYTLLLEQ
jgi:hypothetical protein